MNGGLEHGEEARPASSGVAFEIEYPSPPSSESAMGAEERLAGIPTAVHCHHAASYHRTCQRFRAQEPRQNGHPYTLAQEQDSDC